ncbi:MAG: 23S rRNA (adenine(2503)-C(2))-methyltransferase RlmN [Gemmatimonadales bacterium]|nr:23S rRNA (adenine(2503)-C(2))-methyltransferase RlmN [Gemmatimonadales bacterium]NIN12475.1 23S rRNA (adenine(2503)-C(2))-methyltransferase RlmN [Gemmatimonadales bacterium]NIN50851.1 23S rRNA (adenine(2503)-C(2))-methyltransferase RlmN [Gemmatimonadales bacterium]NIP08315.1 23S rRNA (adenine(2503)-C(2))-methyltransferase RlmN [Gemmatimonadales bacterium]NIR00839.1 23S rRNA (adenine(2503)-C(2))-methyltransferase RlmN [Gemmatimonadales bacterium]
MAQRAEPEYRVRQIMPRLWQRPVARWHHAAELPKALREALEAEFPLPRPVLTSRETSADGTVKFLWEFERGGAVESVLIPDRGRRTLCISAQAGCAYGCVFCATGRMGFVRHLTAWEITAQFRELLLTSEFARATNIVFMGMGEPLHNWSAVNQALTILNDGGGFGVGARHITVSTVGIVPALEKLAARPEQFRVALSLHAPNSRKRRELMPVEAKYPLAQVLGALRGFTQRVTFEYVMIRGVNDSDADARELAGHARSLGALVNVLPLHPGGAPGLDPAPTTDMRRFAKLLHEEGVKATVRKSRGLDINAACGQLRTEVARRRGIPPQEHAGVE